MPQRSALAARSRAQPARRVVAGSWKTSFQKPFVLVDGTVLETLEDAAQYILAMSKGAAYGEWQHAMAGLIEAAESAYDPDLIAEARRRLSYALFMSAKCVEAD